MPWNTLLYVTLRGLAWLLPWIPISLAYRLAGTAGTLAYYLVPAARKNLEANIAQVTDEPAGSNRLRALAIRGFQADAKNWVDTLRIRHISDNALLETVHVDGWEHLDSALAEGKGAILLGIHLGNFDLVGQILLARGYNLIVPVERMRPQALFNFLAEGRRSRGMKIVAVDEAPKELLRTLRAGKIVGVTGDRQIAGKGMAVQFFGRPATLPRGPVSLARLTGAPLLLAYGIRLPSNSFQGYIASPMYIPRAADEATAMGEVARVMEEPIREHVDQWLAFSRVWQPGDSNGADIMVRRKEPAL
jgi:lauroyl/myristoyl acyltransferase